MGDCEELGQYMYLLEDEAKAENMSKLGYWHTCMIRVRLDITIL